MLHISSLCDAIFRKNNYSNATLSNNAAINLKKILKNVIIKRYQRKHIKHGKDVSKEHSKL